MVATLRRQLASMRDLTSAVVFFPFLPILSLLRILHKRACFKVADPDFELRAGHGFDLPTLLAFLPSVISPFFNQNWGGGGGWGKQAPWAPSLDPPLLEKHFPTF